MTLADTQRRGPRRSRAFDELAAPLRPFLPLGLEAKIVLGILAVLGLWGLTITAFGLPALLWPMKIIVPVSVAGLILLTWGRG